MTADLAAGSLKSCAFLLVMPLLSGNFKIFSLASVIGVFVNCSLVGKIADLTADYPYLYSYESSSTLYLCMNDHQRRIHALLSKNVS